MLKNRWFDRKKEVLKEIFIKIRYGKNKTRIIVLQEPNILEGNYYRFIVIIFRIAQLWPYPHPTQSSFRKLLIRILYYTLVLTIIIPQILWALEGEYDVYDFILTYSTVLFHLISMTKYTAILQNRLWVQALFDEIRNDWQSITNTEERKLLVDYTNLGYFYTNVYVVSASVGWFVINLVQYLPIMAEAYVNTRNNTKLRVFQNPGHYVIDLGNNADTLRCLHFTVITFLNLCVLGSIDIFFLMCASHISGMFDILSYKVNQCGRKLNDKKKSEDCDYFLKELRQIVTFHTEILQNVVRLQNTLTHSMLIVELICLSMLPMTLFVCYDAISYPILTGQSAVFFIAFILEVFLFNAVGQRIIDQSGKIYNSTYCSDWYNLPIEYQRLLRLIMIRSIHSSKLTAGKLSILSLSAFLTILKTVFSYYAVLMSVL